MKIWIKRVLVLLFLVALAPAARLLEWMLSHLFGAGDGTISRFSVNHAVAALPTVVGFLVLCLCLWWLRNHLANKKLMLLLCTVLMVFGVLEFAAEILVKSRPKPPEVDNHEHRVPYPYIEFKGSYQSGLHNALGYGGKVPEKKKEKGEYRIFFLGGSTVRFGAPPIPVLVEQLFRAEGFEDVQVFNFGVSGSNTGMELGRLVYEILPYRPDMIVNYGGGNDIDLPIVKDPRPGYPFNFMVKEYNPLLDKDYPLAALTAYGSDLFRSLGRGYFHEKFSRVEELRRSTGWNSQAWRDQIAEAYAYNIETSARIANAFDSDFVAFLQPTLLTKKKLTEKEQVYMDRAIRSVQRIGMTSAELKLHDERVRSQINLRLSATQKRDIWFVDLSAVFDDVETSTYVDFIHTEQHADSLIAARIFETLRARKMVNSR